MTKEERTEVETEIRLAREYVQGGGRISPAYENAIKLLIFSLDEIDRLEAKLAQSMEVQAALLDIGAL